MCPPIKGAFPRGACQDLFQLGEEQKMMTSEALLPAVQRDCFAKWFGVFTALRLYVSEGGLIFYFWLVGSYQGICTARDIVWRCCGEFKEPSRW